MILKTKNLFIIFLILVSNSLIFGQNTFSISGKIIDENQQSFPFATIQLLKLPDSTFVVGDVSKDDGTFLLKNIKNGNHLLKINFVGYKEYLSPISIQNQSIELPTIQLQSDVIALNEVIITAPVIDIRQKNDTTEYDAAAYKVNSDANVENLVGKMPGITIQNGKVQAAGEDVKKITIDGQEYFGDDALIALKNLPADVVKKIQVFDGQTDQARLTGVDDGNTIKTINIITKNPDAMLTFGKISAGYGNKNYYNLNGNINVFDGKQRFSVLGTSNNVNQQNFSSEDLLGVASQQGRKRRSSNDNDFSVDENNGLNTTNSIGLNYINNWKDKITLNGSYFYNYAKNKNTIITDRTYLVDDDNEQLSYFEDKNNRSNNYNHRVKLKLQYEIDSNNTLIFTPRISFQNAKGNGLLNGKNEQNFSLINTNTTNNNNLNDGYQLNNELLFVHKFKKKGRVLSTNFNYDKYQSTGESQLNYVTYDVVLDSIITSKNQQTLSNNSTENYATKLNFREPISENGSLQFSYSPSLKYTKNHKENSLLNTENNTYSILDTLLTNKLNTQIFGQRVGTNYEYKKEKITLNFGVDYLRNELKGDYLFPDFPSIEKNFQGILPNFNFKYKFSKNSDFRIRIRTDNTIPSVQQLQAVVNNSNPLQLVLGNSNLKQANVFTFYTRYTKANLTKKTSFFTSINIQNNHNYIGQASYIATQNTITVNDIVLTPNTQLITYKNLGNQFIARSYICYGLPVLKNNFTVESGLSFIKTPGETNDILNQSKNTTATFGASFNSTKSEKLDYNFSYNINQNWITNSILRINNNFTTHKFNAKINYVLKERWVFNINTTMNLYRGLNTLSNQNPVFCNVFWGYKWLKNKNLETKIGVFDVFNQNVGINRNTTAIYIEDVNTSILKRYFLFTITYRFNKIFDNTSTEN